MEIAILIGILILLVLLVLVLLEVKKSNHTPAQLQNFTAIQQDFSAQLHTVRQELSSEMQTTMRNLGTMMAENQKQVGAGQAELLQTTQQHMIQQLQQFEQRIQSLEKNMEQRQEHLRNTIAVQFNQAQEQQKAGTQELQQQLRQLMQDFNEQLCGAQRKTGQHQAESLQEMSTHLRTQLQQFEARLKTMESTNLQSMEQVRSTVAGQLQTMQVNQKNSLDEIRGMVDEKLTKTLEDSLSRSFQRVSKQLEDVYKGLGEMQSLASGVGDLKKVLSNVKTRGILGEIQLGAILQEILAPEQYETEIPTIPGSRNHVEFAVKLPGDGENTIYLPIDSKFPGETYGALQDAYESGNPEQVAAARKTLVQVIRGCAKDIHDKYVEPPYTTNFGILFLPFEGLYAEVVNTGLVEQLQREYHINIAGPSTMAAMLNALQMGFRTLAIQKRSSEVWAILGAVKTEFEKFGDVLTKAQKSLQGAEKHLETLMGTRTNAINRKLREVEQLEPQQAQQLLELTPEELSS